MKLIEIKELMEEWIDVGDWDDAELELFDSKGNKLNDDASLDTRSVNVSETYKKDILNFINSTTIKCR